MEANADVESQQPKSTVTMAPRFQPVPEKRKKRARCVSVIICTITAILVIAFCVVNRNVLEYNPDTKQKNSTNVGFIKEEKLGFPGLLTTALGLFGVVLGTLVDRLSLVNEERYHLKQRYDGSKRKMIKACFSGILWGPVIALLGSTAVIVIILIFATNRPWFEMNYLVIIFSGIGVGPLIMHLLNLNTQSEVHISTILEEKAIDIANGLAWSYYFNYLKQALPKFKETRDNEFPAPYQNIKLASNKLLLLLPLDCHTVDDLSELDTDIKKVLDTGNDHDPYRFPVYCLTNSQNEKYDYAIKFISEPLETLKQMSNLEEIKSVKKKTLEEEIKLLCRTLSGILRDPPDRECREMCILVPYKTESLESLKNGGLVKCIMDALQSGSTQGDGAPGFAVRPTEEQSVNIPEPTKSVDKNAKTVKNQKYSSPTYNDKQTAQIDISNNQANDSSGKKGKKLKSKFTNKTSADPERQKMISAENSDTDDKNKTKENKKMHSTQEVGDKNDIGASTSGITSEITATDTKRQSDQQDEQSPHQETEM